MNKVNSKLAIQRQFNFFLVNAELKVLKQCTKYKKEESFIYLNEWYEPNGVLTGLVNVPLTILHNIIDFSSRSIEVNLETEKAWLNRLKNIDENQSKILN